MQVGGTRWGGGGVSWDGGDPRGKGGDPTGRGGAPAGVGSPAPLSDGAPSLPVCVPPPVPPLSPSVPLGARVFWPLCPSRAAAPLPSPSAPLTPGTSPGDKRAAT